MWAQAFVILFAAALPAQVVSPGHFTLASGNARSAAGLGLGAIPCRHLQIHDDMSGVPLSINGIALRRYGGTSRTYASFRVTATLFISTARTTSAAPDPSFDANHGIDRTQALPGAQVVLPSTLPGVLTRPFEYVIPFASPFTFGGQGPLCWDLMIVTRTNAFPVDLDAVDGIDPDPRSPVGPMGQGCFASGQSDSFGLEARASFDWSRSQGSIRYRGTSGPRGGIGQIYFGLYRATFGGVPLPYELPGTRAGSSGPCWVHVHPLTILPIVFDATGGTDTAYRIPLDFSLHGSTLLNQLLAVDLQANNWLMVLSNGVWVNVVAPWAISRVGEVVAEAPPITVGTPRPGRGAIVQFW